MQQAMSRLVDNARVDLRDRAFHRPMGLLRAVAGVAYVGPGSEWREPARRMVDILVAGLRKPSAHGRP